MDLTDGDGWACKPTTVFLGFFRKTSDDNEDWSLTELCNRVTCLRILCFWFLGRLVPLLLAPSRLSVHSSRANALTAPQTEEVVHFQPSIQNFRYLEFQVAVQTSCP